MICNKEKITVYADFIWILANAKSQRGNKNKFISIISNKTVYLLVIIFNGSYVSLLKLAFRSCIKNIQSC